MGERIASQPIARPATYGQRGYLYATTRNLVLGRNGDRFADYDLIVGMVDQVLDRCALRVATFDGDVDDETGRVEIHGFVVEDERDKTIEFFHINRLYRDMPTPVLAARVARALLGDRSEVVLRRGPTAEALKAIVAAEYKPIVRPRSV